MIRQCRITFWVPRAERDRYYRLLQREGLLEGWEEPDPVLPRSNPRFDHVFEGDDPKAEGLRTLMRGKACDWNEQVTHAYDDAELSHFPLLRLAVRRPSIRGGGPEFGTVYDVSAACPRCGTGAVQTSPLKMASASPPKRGLLVETHQCHLLVAKELAAAFRHASVSGLELRQARSQRGNKTWPWWQVIPSRTMPKMSKKTKGIVRDTDPGWGCPVCGRDCHGETGEQPTEICYDRRQVKPATLPDVVQTWECFGRSALPNDTERELTPGYAQPLILVKPKVLDIIRELGGKEAVFSPVWIK